MAGSLRRRCGFVVAVIVLALGCGRQAPAPVAGPSPSVADEPPSPTPGEVELSEPRVTMVRPGRVRFEVKYRFTKGRPDKCYQWEINFPGTPPNNRFKPMQHWELKPEGVIRDQLDLTTPGVKTFEIRLTESTSPQIPYTPISNVVRGTVQASEG